MIKILINNLKDKELWKMLWITIQLAVLTAAPIATALVLNGVK